MRLSWPLPADVAAEGGDSHYVVAVLAEYAFMSA